MSAKPILYYMDVVPGARAVKRTAHLIGLELELRPIDLYAKEQFSEVFLKINPQYTIPTLQDNGKVIWESSVICTYLIDKYAKDDSLYPNDLYERARYNQRIHFTEAILYQRLKACTRNYYQWNAEVPENDINNLHDALKIFETLLSCEPYLTGDRLTVADVCAISFISCYDQLYVPIESSNYPKVHAWFQLMKSLSFPDTLERPHIQKHKRILNDINAKNKLIKKE